MERNNILKTGIVLGLIVLFIGASVTSATLNTRGRSVPDADESTVELTSLPHFLLVCPQGDGGTYQYIKITCIDATGTPVVGLQPEHFSFDVSAVGGDTSWAGTLSCTFTAVDAQTNAQGEIRFEMIADTSIVGNISIEVTVLGVTISTTITITCKSPDLNTSGSVDFTDFTLFSNDWLGIAWRSDFDCSGSVDFTDFTVFSNHWLH